jgi:hypothetical protein
MNLDAWFLVLSFDVEPLVIGSSLSCCCDEIAAVIEPLTKIHKLKIL